MKQLLLLGLLCLVSCANPNYQVFSGYAQGGTYAVKINMKGVSTSREVIAESIDSLLTEIDNSISGYNKNSLLSRFNSGEIIEPDRHFSKLIQLSEYYNRLTNGAFDVWGGPLFDIWGFGFKSGELPTEAQIQEALTATREHKQLNFNAIAQGYSCDIIADYLRSIGVKDMLVDIGEIYCSGLNPKAKGWAIAVDNPIDGNNTPGQDITGIWTSDGTSCGIVTSGNYRKFYIKDNRKYAHTIDTRTGYPVGHNLLSATILAPSAAEADAIATACMVMGLEESKLFINSKENIEAYLIFDGGYWVSDGFSLTL